MGRIILVLLSEIDKHIGEVLKQVFEKTFNRTVEIMARISSLDYAFDSSRNQYISPRVLSRLRRIRKGQDDKILGIVDVDLYSPGYDFVFGEAEIGSGVATVSFYRLLPESYVAHPDRRVFEGRTAKEAVHELGHLFHLGHCPNPNCVMHFSTSLGDIDKKDIAFCSKCHHKLKDNLE